MFLLSGGGGRDPDCMASITKTSKSPSPEPHESCEWGLGFRVSRFWDYRFRLVLEEKVGPEKV